MKHFNNNNNTNDDTDDQKIRGKQVILEWYLVDQEI